MAIRGLLAYKFRVYFTITFLKQFGSAIRLDFGMSFAGTFEVEVKPNL